MHYVDVQDMVGVHHGDVQDRGGVHNVVCRTGEVCTLHSVEDRGQTRRCLQTWPRDQDRCGLTAEDTTH